MRKLVYEHAQAEKPAGVERKRWDGTDMPAKAAAAAKAAPAAAKAAPAKPQPKAAPSTADMSSQIFSKFDANQDGKLSRAEMQARAAHLLRVFPLPLQRGQHAKTTPATAGQQP